MPSRKRNKGKERKLKKEAAEAASKRWRVWAAPMPLGAANAQCNHGCAMLPPPDHAVSRFMNTFESLIRKDALHLMKNMFEICPEVWKVNEHRQLAINLFLRMGTNLILSQGVDNRAVRIARSILFLECYDGTDNFRHAFQDAMLKGSVYFHSCGERDALKFYSKRLPCPCLKQQYKQARKSLPKVGLCVQCEKNMERSNLMTCGRCKVVQFCSRGCQVANWPNHKDGCGLYVEARKRQEACAKEKSQSMGG